MTHIKKQFNLLLMVCFFSCSINADSQMSAPSFTPSSVDRGPGDVMLSPQELEELQAMEQLVEQERAKMTPQQRAEFDNTVAQLTKELEKMQPEELDAFISQVIFGQDPNAVPEEPPMPQQHYTPQPYAHSEKNEEISKVDTSREKRDEALAAINTIIAYSKNFIDKMNTAPAFEPTLKKWVAQKKIKNGKSTTTWESIKQQIEDLIQKLEAIKEVNSETNQYKYLNEVANDAELCINLNNFANLVKDNEHNLEIDPLGYDSISAESKHALTTLVNGYLDMLNVKNIIVALQNIMATHAQYTNDEEGEFSSLQLPEIKTQPSRVPKNIEKKSAVATPAKNQTETKEDDSATSRLINKLDNALESAADNIKNSALATIKTHLADTKETQPNCDVANNYLPSTIKKIKTATGNIKALKVNVKSLPAEEQKKQSKVIKETCQKHKATFDDIIKQAQWIKTHENVVSPEKKYAFLAGSPTANSKDILYPSSLYELQSALEEFTASYKTL